MDPLRSYLGRLLQEEITPVIMVLSTPLVEDACQKNGLNFIELLLPFSVFNKINGGKVFFYLFFYVIVFMPPDSFHVVCFLFSTCSYCK